MTMTKSDLPDGSNADETAHWLLAQHDGRLGFQAVQFQPGGNDETFVYAVQDRLNGFRRERGEVVAGYKIGLTTPVMQQLCHGDRPIAGVMFQRTIRVAPASVRARDYVRLGIECELALRLGTALPASGTVDRATVAASVARVAAAFELIEDLGADYATLDWRSMAADNGWHGGLVLGPDVAVDKVEGLDAGLDGRLEIDGHPSLMGSTRDVLGHPYDAVAWLANHLAGRGERLLAGQWISTGSIVPIRHAVPGQRFRFSIASLPAVEITVT